MAEPTPTVSVLIITYNHEQFVGQAIQSALDQEPSDQVEIVVGEDHSTDGTRAVLLDFQRRYPTRIRLLLRDANVGMNRNLAMTLAACRGRYIALLEGDDYWTRPDKLKLQVEFLDRHPGFSACFHNVEVVGDLPQPRPFLKRSPGRVFSLRDVVTRQFIPTCSTVFRSGLAAPWPDWFFDFPMGDWPLHVMNAQRGPIGYLDLMMGAYRIHSGGVWSGSPRPQVLLKSIAAAATMDQFLGHQYTPELSRLASGFRLELARTESLAGNHLQAREHLAALLRTIPWYRGRFWRGIRAWLLVEWRRLGSR